jgi:hypothetical protein
MQGSSAGQNSATADNRRAPHPRPRAVSRRRGVRTSLLGLVGLLALAMIGLGAVGARDESGSSGHGAPPKTACEGARSPATSELSYRLENGAFPGSDSEAPDVAVHVPPGFDASRRPGVILYFHGWRGCVSAAVAPADTACSPGGPPRSAANLAAQVDDARVNALVVAVELRADMPSGEPGRLASPGALRLLLHELLTTRLESALGCPIEVDTLDRVVVIAHSGGYQAAAAALQVGDVPQIREVVLLDALYGAQEVFERWVSDDAHGFAPANAPRLRWVDLYTCCAGTAEASKTLARSLQSHLAAAGTEATVDDGTAELDPAMLRQSVVFKRVPRAHQELPRAYAREIIESAGFAPIQPR